MDERRREECAILRSEVPNMIRMRNYLLTPVVTTPVGIITLPRHCICKGSERFIMSVAFQSVYLHLAFVGLLSLLHGPIGADKTIHFARIACATMFAILVVASMAMVRPARTPMKEAREKRKTVWSQLRIGGLQASIEFDVDGAKREPKVTIEIIGSGGRRSRAFAWAAGN